MTRPIAMVACSSLRPEIEALAPDIETAYVPHELHESPLDPGRDEVAATAIENAIESVATPSLRYVALAYARSNPAIAGLRAPEIPIATWRAADCVEALCDRPVGPYGEAKATGAYYVTPGAIDAGLDPYKLHLAYRGRVESLVAEFESAGRDVSWHTGERITALIDDGPRPDPAVTHSHFATQFGAFDRVVLLDTGQTAPIHRRYAQRLADFLYELTDDTEAVSVDEQPADLSLLAVLLVGDALTDDRVDVIAPGQPIGDTNATDHNQSLIQTHD